jgi:hypothetical protein
MSELKGIITGERMIENKAYILPLPQSAIMTMIGSVSLARGCSLFCLPVRLAIQCVTFAIHMSVTFA